MGDIKQTLEELTEEGLSQRKIAEKMRYSRWYIRHLLEKFGLKTKTSVHLKIPEEISADTFYTRRYTRKLRRKILERFGNKCVKCGFNDWRALQIDHVQGKGTLKRRNKEGKRFPNTTNFYRQLLEMSIDQLKKEYQLLCANCNWVKKYENNHPKNDCNAFKPIFSEEHV